MNRRWLMLPEFSEFLDFFVMDENTTENVGGASGLPVSPYLCGRWRRFLNGRGKGPGAWTLEDVEAAFFEGVEAKADQLGAGMLARELAATEELEEREESFSKKELFEAFRAGGDAREKRLGLLPDFDVALIRLACAECSDEWSYNPDVLQRDSGVILLASLYEKPVLEVARGVSDVRREWVKRYLADFGCGASGGSGAGARALRN